MAQQPLPLAEWLRCQGGAVHEALSLTHDLPGGGRGVVAQSAISTGSELIRVPQVGCLHCGTRGAGAAGSASPDQATTAPFRQVQGVACCGSRFRHSTMLYRRPTNVLQLT